jgi:hypothetical protein
MSHDLVTAGFRLFNVIDSAYTPSPRLRVVPTLPLYPDIMQYLYLEKPPILKIQKAPSSHSSIRIDALKNGD